MDHTTPSQQQPAPSEAAIEAAIEAALSDLIGAHRVEAATLATDGEPPVFPLGWIEAKRAKLIALMRRAAAPEPSKATEEVAWLIERRSIGDRRMWWVADARCAQWGTPSQAVRFARKEDAERIIHNLLGRDAEMLVATEHSWPAVSPLRRAAAPAAAERPMGLCESCQNQFSRDDLVTGEDCDLCRPCLAQLVKEQRALEGGS